MVKYTIIINNFMSVNIARADQTIEDTNEQNNRYDGIYSYEAYKDMNGDIGAESSIMYAFDDSSYIFTNDFGDIFDVAKDIILRRYKHENGVSL